MQVQSLLQRQCVELAGDMVSFNNIMSLQQQNKKLLRDHHSMTDKIAELEDKIKNNPNGIELKSRRLDVGLLHKEREKQAILVAGIVHQHDLFRALVVKNDAPLTAHKGQGQDQLALVDA
jgi:nucleoprotein TPR